MRKIREYRNHFNRYRETITKIAIQRSIQPGDKFGRLTIQKPVGTYAWGIIFECLCDCGKTANIGGFGLIRPKNPTESCGCHQRERSRQVHQCPPGISSYRAKYRAYARSANHKKICFDLTLGQFIDIVKKPCSYCGKEPSQFRHRNTANGWCLLTGIDRTNSSEGYTLSNSVSCCWMCNCFKNKFSVDEFVNHARKIVAYANYNLQRKVSRT